jgi:four helix bundle protein
MNELKDLEVYLIARDLSGIAWNMYKDLKNEHRLSIGQQFIRSTDSVGANIAEGFGRYHYMDSAKFYYNARGSLHESKHWADLLCERNLIAVAAHKDFVKQAEILGVKLNNFISSIKNRVVKNNSK